MKIYINGQETAIPQSARVLQHYLPEIDPDKPFAVAVNGDFIARVDYGKFELQDGDQVDIVSPVGGG